MSMLSDGRPALDPSRNASEPDPGAAAAASAAAESSAASSSASGSDPCDANTPVLAAGAAIPSSPPSCTGQRPSLAACRCA